MAVALQVDFPNYYYNPDTGRFLSEDPIGFLGGDANLYRYVGNNSLNYVDPSGEGFLFIGVLAVLGGIYIYGEYCDRVPLACDPSPPSPPSTFPPFNSSLISKCMYCRRPRR